MTKTIGRNAPTASATITKRAPLTRARKRSDKTASQVTPRHGQEVRFGDLMLCFTSQFAFRWNDGGSGAHDDVSFYHPIAPKDYFVLGSVGCAGGGDPNGNTAALCVKPAAEVSGKAPLAPPLRYDYVWDDSGSGADLDGSCWRPVAPDGYCALGDVFVEGHSAPALTDVMCVALELVADGKVGGQIWNDGGSGADRDFSAWQIDVSQAYQDTSDGFFAVNTFTGTASHDQPGLTPVVHTLRLPLPTFEGGDLGKPTLDSRIKPASGTTPVVDRIVTVPFTAIIDNDKTFQWKMANSPFYDVQRSVYYSLAIFDDNQTEKDKSDHYTLAMGVTKEQSQTFSITTGIKISYESGVEAGGFSTKVGIELSIELGYSTTSSVAVFQSVTDDAELVVPAMHAGALWVESNSLQLIRSDNTAVGPALAFNAGGTAYLACQYPAPSDEAGSRVKHRRFPSRLRGK